MNKRYIEVASADQVFLLDTKTDLVYKIIDNVGYIHKPSIEQFNRFNPYATIIREFD